MYIYIKMGLTRLNEVPFSSSLSGSVVSAVGCTTVGRLGGCHVIGVWAELPFLQHALRHKEISVLLLQYEVQLLQESMPQSLQQQQSPSLHDEQQSEHSRHRLRSLQHLGITNSSEQIMTEKINQTNVTTRATTTFTPGSPEYSDHDRGLSVCACVCVCVCVGWGGEH